MLLRNGRVIGTQRRAAAAVACAALVAALAPAARALPPPEAPRGAPSSSPTPAPAGAVLPFGSTLYFVLDDRIDSGSTPAGAKIRMHLKSPLVLNGVEVAPAGAPASLVVLATSKAQSGDVDGAVAVHIDPLALPGRDLALPVRALHEYLNIEYSSGQESTRETTDTIGDIFIPGHLLYHAFRRGRQYVLPPGSVLRAQTAATIEVTNAHAVVLSTPPPFKSTYDVPHADLTAAPLYTPAPERPKPLPKGKPTLPPTPAPSPSPPLTTPSPAASATAAATATATATPAPASASP